MSLMEHVKDAISIHTHRLYRVGIAGGIILIETHTFCALPSLIQGDWFRSLPWDYSPLSQLCSEWRWSSQQSFVSTVDTLQLLLQEYTWGGRGHKVSLILLFSSLE